MDRIRQLIYKVRYYFDGCRIGEGEIAGLEARVESAATDCVARKVELIVTGNYLVKQRRQRYYLDHLDTLEALLRQRLALDKLLCAMIQVSLNLFDISWYTRFFFFYTLELEAG